MPNDADRIARAKAQRDEWRDQQRQHHAETRFNRCTPDELIRIAETGRDLEGRPLRDGDDIMALDDAWFGMFGEALCSHAGEADDAALATTPTVETEPVPLDQHPMLAIPDDAMLRPRDVRRVFGYARTTLNRHIKAGHFPKPQRAAPGQRFVGWPARQLKAWLGAREAR